MLDTWVTFVHSTLTSIRLQRGMVRCVTSNSDGTTSLNLLTHGTHVLRTAWQTAIRRAALQKPIAIDATAGRGSDTLSLCELLGSEGTVYSIDIQQDALNETGSRYSQLVQSLNGSSDEQPNIAKLSLHLGCHSDLRARTSGSVNDSSTAVITYNLGWYPGTNADRSIITRTESTVHSLRSAECLLAPGGVISVMAYIGHDGGSEEEQAVHSWAASLSPRQWTVVHMTYPNRHMAPTMLLCEKRL